MKTGSWHWRPFLVACSFASLIATGGCTFDASQLRALPDMGGVAGGDAPTATGGVEGRDAATITTADGPAAVGAADAGSMDGAASDLVTPLPDAPQPSQPDASEGTGKDGATVVGGADAKSLDSGASDLVTPTPDAPQSSQPDSSEGTTCSNLCLKQVRCDGGATTSISGTVYDPAGLNPLYNVIVSIPNAALDPIPAGASCTSCDAQVSGQPIAAALTDASGHFVLNNVPWSTDFPLVMQLGKWRRQVTIPAAMVTHQCADNPIADNLTDAALPNRLLRLPRNIHDGDNNGQYTSMPKIAITTGQIDALECLLARIGIDTAEFTDPAATGHVNLYSLVPTSDANESGNGATSYASGGTFPVAQTGLFNATGTEQNYDIIMMNCPAGVAYFNPGGSYVTDAFIQNLKTYVNGGGKVLLEHLFAGFLMTTSTLTTAPYGNIATWEPTLSTAAYLSSTDLDTYIDQSFTKGQVFSQWLMNVHASTVLGRLQLSDAAASTKGRYTAKTTTAPATRWIYNPVSATDSTSSHVHYFDLLAPTDQTSKCGRIVYTGIHASSSSSGTDQDALRILGGTPVFPTECAARPLNSQEKAMEFMFFDLSGCVNPIVLPTTPPLGAGA